MKTEILYIDMDNVLVDFPSAFNKLNKEKLKDYKGRLDEVPGIFSLMEPLEGAKEAFDVLAAAVRYLHSFNRTVGKPLCMER